MFMWHFFQFRWVGQFGSTSLTEVAWSFPITGDLKGYVQVFSGYGGSLIDFNNRQTGIGFGLSVVDWF